MHATTSTTSRTLVADLAGTLMERIDAIASDMAQLTYDNIEFYRTMVVDPKDLHASMVHNVQGIIAHLVSAEPSAIDLSGPTETGRRRAEQNAPLPEVLRAYRISFQFFWEQLLAEARKSGGDAPGALLDQAAHIWEIADAFSSALTDSYRETCAERMVETDRRRSALVGELIDGPSTATETVWEVARMLDFPFQGSFLVVTADALTSQEPPLPSLDRRLRTLGVASAWRAQRGSETGVLSCPQRRPLEEILDAVRASATSRVGVSPLYDRLDRTGRALRYAQVAAESLPPGAPAVRQLDDTPLTELVMNNLETTQRAVQRILGGVLSLPEEDRTTLLATARAWLEAHGSAAEAGRMLYCHQNTVRYRMHRLEEFLRGPLDDPKIVAELSMALDAVGTFPMLLERHRAVGDG
ncbi:PucR family transcriptional regulator [Streptomyces cavernicola]|uniref:Helix-turn-helix domain-containing protein n=1 Tax=Streptomyces cavernicola TaxID=3043613 RepID=A0ABT6SAZ9_9ACTN|nr:helix-turn-helix domain-containing protein [Streptomyces sp. B-S-A6]MDI3405372.1 helix-turn-helix domain-containing protein [Streptomyces sp. B-S-A6]